MKNLIIIGAGHAGGTLAALLRQNGFADDIVLIGNEKTAPYQRPPLSKAYLKGEASLDDLLLKSHDFYQDHRIDLLLGREVIEIDTRAKKIRTDQGETLFFDRLVIATGSKLRALPVQTTAKIHSLYNIDQAELLLEKLTNAHSIGIIGAGFIGLEVAATARLKGLEVEVIEKSDRLLSRACSPELSEILKAAHQQKGVNFSFGQEIEAIQDISPDQISLTTKQGKKLSVSLVLAGIGTVAHDGLAQTAGIDCDNGIIVNEFCQSSHHDIFAIGDVSVRTHSLVQKPFRFESVANALEQARILATHLTDRPLPKPEVPWFWSDQYDLKVQIAGLYEKPSATFLRQDEIGSSLLHLDAKGRLSCVEAVNRPADFMAGKLLIQKGQKLERSDELSNAALALKSWL